MLGVGLLPELGRSGWSCEVGGQVGARVRGSEVLLGDFQKLSDHCDCRLATINRIVKRKADSDLSNLAWVGILFGFQAMAG